MNQTDGVIVIFCICPATAIFLGLWIATRLGKRAAKEIDDTQDKDFP